jgi:hypothetical protein
MASKIPATGSVPTVHVAGVAMGVAPSVAKGTKDPCRHRRNKKKQKFVVYMAAERGSTGNYYVGRTRGTGTIDQIINNRERGHHRTDIGRLKAVCTTDTYSACRGAEQKHYDHMAAQNKVITSPRAKGRGEQIAPVAADSPKKKDYMDCAKASAQPAPPGCAICAA